MKRFYRDVTVVEQDECFAIMLDGRPVRTPARSSLALPNRALADAIAQEWRVQGDMIDPGAMPFTGLANAAIDYIVPNRDSFVADIARYAQSDLLCYRADGPDALVVRQAAAWEPLLDWARARYDLSFVVTQGILPVQQPVETIARLHTAVAGCDAFTLAGLSTLVMLSGSLVCGLAIVAGGHNVDAIWQAAEIDEVWQVERWGEDDQAAVRSARRATDFSIAGAFCAMSRP